MNRKEAAQVLAILTAGYPKYFKNMKDEELQGVVSLWSMQFANISAEVVVMALHKAISVKEEFPPTIAEVKKKLESVYWEAYEKIDRNYRLKNLSEQELATYKRICKESERYKFGKSVEPAISDMLPKRNVKQIERSG